MEYEVKQDDIGTHLHWKLKGVTAAQIDWFWSNMDKCNLLWHPEEHEPLLWQVSPKHGNPVHSIHIAPQTWGDGVRQNLFIRWERFEDVDTKFKSVFVMEHGIIVAGLGFGTECLENPDPMGYRIHQWQKTDDGVEGISSGIGTRKPETHADGLIWADHCAQEVGNWEVFLPRLVELYKVHTNTDYQPFSDMTVEGSGDTLRYKYIDGNKLATDEKSVYELCSGLGGSIPVP